MKCLTNTERAYVDSIISEYDRMVELCKKADDVQEVGILLKRIFSPVDGWVCFGEKEGHCALVFNRIPADINNKEEVAKACNSLELKYVEVLQGIHFIKLLAESGLIILKWELAPNDPLVPEDVGDVNKYVHLAINDASIEPFIKAHHYASVVPTPQLREFVKNGYIDEETKRHKQSIRVAWAGVIAAIAIGVLSSLVSLLAR